VSFRSANSYESKDEDEEEGLTMTDSGGGLICILLLLMGALYLGFYSYIIILILNKFHFNSHVYDVIIVSRV
jgi:hypothetical protein